MATFNDSVGRTYSFAITLGSVKRVRKALNVDLLNVYDGNPLVGEKERPLDVVAVIDCVYVLVEADAAKHQLADEEWAEAMGPDCMTAAVAAFYSEWTDFFRQLNRPDSAKVIQKTRELVGLAVTAAENRVEKIDPSAIVQAEFGNGSDGSRALLDSTSTTPIG